jgi:bifunctional pyridoxal-dependent enzyme with beta-cystathionase and maltose regulon repressor activities
MFYSPLIKSFIDYHKREHNYVIEEKEIKMTPTSLNSMSLLVDILIENKDFEEVLIFSPVYE